MQQCRVTFTQQLVAIESVNKKWMKNEKIEIQKVQKVHNTLVKVLSFFKLSKAGNTKAGTLNAFGNHLRHRVYIGPYRLP